jgi:Leucine-rich repeat (LRR) protein
LPKEIGSLKNLRILYIGQNLLSALPESLCELESLIEIHLTSSGSTLDIPECLCQLRSLEYVVVSANLRIPNCWLSRKTGRFELIVR